VPILKGIAMKTNSPKRPARLSEYLFAFFILGPLALVFLWFLFFVALSVFHAA
jgi:uncharacterized membrane protein